MVPKIADSTWKLLIGNNVIISRCAVRQLIYRLVKWTKYVFCSCVCMYVFCCCFHVQGWTPPNISWISQLKSFGYDGFKEWISQYSTGNYFCQFWHIGTPFALKRLQLNRYYLNNNKLPLFLVLYSSDEGTKSDRGRVENGLNLHHLHPAGPRSLGSSSARPSLHLVPRMA